MKTHKIIQTARGTLMRRRADIVAAAGEDWQAECIRELQKTTGLTLDDTQTSCEVSFRVMKSGPNDLGPTRPIWFEAHRLASANTDISKAADLLVDHWLTHLVRRGEEDIFDSLGVYFAEDGVVQARAELYWARIAAFSALTKRMTTQMTEEAVAKVVMLHELAHYVTHQGCYKKRHWERFPSGQDVVEIVAQVATEDVIRRLNDDRLLAAFECLLKNAPAKYSAHRQIAEKLRSEFADSKVYPQSKSFWPFFHVKIQPSSLTTTASLHLHIKVTRALISDEHDVDFDF
ncbi:MAG: hypothetical protein RL077_163 [Verrucomicrobiota bacterium]|jgi:hypothetical protein